ncbi:C4-type zinc ribbon domain-containing protein [soil metagenome]
MRLWRLHQIDAGLQEVRQRAASLNSGKGQQERLAELEAVAETHPYRKRHAEKIDLELANRTVEDKIKRLTEQLYGGSVVSSREVATVEKEIESLKRQRDKNDEILLGMMEELPGLEASYKATAASLDEAKSAVSHARKAAVALKGELENRFKEYNAARPEAAKIIPPALLAKYEGVRKAKGTGMAMVVNRQTCGGCGTALPERLRQAAEGGRVVACETCMRILYYTEGLV